MTRREQVNRRLGGLGDIGNFLAALWNGRQSGGAITPNSDTTKIDIAAGNYMVDGIYVAGQASSAKVLTGLSPTAVTSGSQYAKVLCTVTQTGTYTLYVGNKAATQLKALLPAVPAGECYVGHLELPVSFTAGSTAVTEGMCKQNATAAAGLGQF